MIRFKRNPYLFNFTTKALYFLLVPVAIFCTDVIYKSESKTFYISAEGDDTNDGLTENTPWKSAAQVREYASFQPGDRILFRRGDIFDNLLLVGAGNGTEAKPIVIGDYGDKQLPKPILDAGGKSSSKTLYLKNMSHVHITNLSFRGGKKYQIYIVPESADCNGIKISNCHIDGTNGEDGIRVETDIESGHYFGAHGLEISYCKIENCGLGNSTIADGIKAPNIQQNALIQHNTFYNNVSEAIDIGAGKNHLVAYNLIDGNNGKDSGGIKTLVQSGNGINDTENITIRNNVFINCVQSSIQVQDGRNIKVYHNSIYSNSKGKLILLLGTANDDQYDAQEWIWGNEIRNNILYSNQGNPDQAIIKFVGNNRFGPAEFWNVKERYNFQNNIVFAGDHPASVMVPWRSDRVSMKLDKKTDASKTPQARRQKRRRVIGTDNSTRCMPENAPKWSLC